MWSGCCRLPTQRFEGRFGESSPVILSASHEALIRSCWLALVSEVRANLHIAKCLWHVAACSGEPSAWQSLGQLGLWALEGLKVSATGKIVLPWQAKFHASL
eukprot:4467934-Amphidinium_carterae.1